MNYTGVRVIAGSTIDTSNFFGAITEFSLPLEIDTDYVFQFKIINYTDKHIFNHIVIIDETGEVWEISQPIDINNFPVVNKFEDEGIIKEERLCHVIFTCPIEGRCRFGVGRTQSAEDNPGDIIFDIREVCCEKGTTLLDYKHAEKDFENFIVRCDAYFERNDNRFLLLAKKEDDNRTNAKIEVAQNQIMLAVERKIDEDSIISAINMSPEEIQIDTNRLNLQGNLDLTGTFKCYRDGATDGGDYLYQYGAMQRGYLNGAENPCFSSGIWRPTGDEFTGYVSVGYTNSDHVDENGCLWMSPLIGGGAEIIYSKLIAENTATISGIVYNRDGGVYYRSAKPGLENNVPLGIGHEFDTSIKTEGNVNVRHAIYSTDNTLALSYDGDPSSPYCVYLQNDGYMFPKGNTQLGTEGNPWWSLVCRYAPQVVSDGRKKKNIRYLDDTPTTYSLRDRNTNLTKNDMYNFIKDDLRLATYEMESDEPKDMGRVSLGFIAQDIMDSKVGSYVVNAKDPDNLTYDLANRITVLEGALQIAIEKIEELTKRLEE